MKSFILTICVLVLGASNISNLLANGNQEPSGEKIASTEDGVFYATCIIYHPLNSSKIKSIELILPPELDMRREESVGPVLKVYGADGKLALMHNATEVLNFMSKNGWEFKDVFSITATGKNMISYIFIKKIT